MPAAKVLAKRAFRRALTPAPAASRETDPRVLVAFSFAGLAVAGFYAVFFSTRMPAAILAGTALLCMVIATAAIVAAGTRHTTTAAVLVVTTAGVALVAASAALTTRSDVHMLYFAVAFSMLALFPERLLRVRVAYACGLFGALIACEFAFRESPIATQLGSTTLENLAVGNRLWTVALGVGAMAVILARSASQRRALFGAASNEEQRANTDVLTSLANRRPVLQRFASFDGTSAAYTVVVVDVDNFKLINDSYGHDAGDKVIVEVGERLVEHFGPRSLVSRWGGDEFLIIVENEAPLALVLSLERLRKTMSKFPVKVAEDAIAVQLSIGAARAVPGAMAEDVLMAADAALYTAKHQGRNQVVMAAERAVRV